MKKLHIRLAAFFLAVVIFAGIFPAMPVSAKSSKPYLIKVNKKMCTVTVYKQDKKGKYTVPVKAMLCSTGAETPLGTFKTPAKYRWRLLMGDVWGQYSTRIVNGILFHSVWYYDKDPSTLSNHQFNKLGKMVSHGCIRLNVEDSKWIYDNCPLGTTVVIYNSDNPGPLGKPKGIKVSESKKMGYDPTDIWSKNNPYIKKKPTFSGVKNRTVSWGQKNVWVKEYVTAKSITGEDVSSLVRATILYDGERIKHVNTKQPGKYYVTYRVTDPLGKKATKKAVYTVLDDAKPVISTGDDLYWKEDREINDSVILDGVTAEWKEESFPVENMTYEISPEKDEEGLKAHKITYSIEAPNGETGEAERWIYIDKKAPVIEGTINSEFTVESEDGMSGQLDTSLLLENLTVSDNLSELSREDISITMELLWGDCYRVKYTVSDQAGNQTMKEAQIRVIQKKAEPIEIPSETPEETPSETPEEIPAEASEEK